MLWEMDVNVRRNYMIEREIRFKIDDEIKSNIISSSELLEESTTCIDLCMGKYGFDSLDKLGYIIRIRNKNGKINMESKRKLENNKWNEASIPLQNIEAGFDFLKNLGLLPYLYINRTREIRKIKQAKICLDSIDLLGDYVEFELEDGFEFEDLKQYIEKNKIQGNPAPLYGDIFKECMSSLEFKEKFDNRLKEVLTTQSDK